MHFVNAFCKACRVANASMLPTSSNSSKAVLKFVWLDGAGVGAEKVLARVWHEHVESKMYDALTWGQIDLQRRTLAASGDLNAPVFVYLLWAVRSAR